MKLNLITIACLLTVLFSSMVSAEQKASVASVEQNESLPDDQLNLAVQSYIRTGKTISSIKRRLMSQYYKTDKDGKGVSQSDYDLNNKIQQAKSRSYKIQQWITMDLDGNGSVTKEELQTFHYTKASGPIYYQGIYLTPTEDQKKLILEKFINKSLKNDINKDNEIVFSEILEQIKKDQDKRLKYKRSSYKKYQFVPLSLDLDKNGTVSKSEFENAVDRILAATDTDKDKQISREEYNDYRKHISVLRRNIKR